MLRQVKLTAALLLACALTLTAVFAGPQETPHRFNPRSLDGALVTLVSPADGTVWSAWAYRNGAEYDIAVAFKDASGFWSEPVFLGRSDRNDQIQPALVMDDSGHLYLAFTDRTTGAVMLSVLPAGQENWFTPVTVTDEGERGLTPALSVVEQRLVVAYRSGRQVVIRDYPLLPPSFLQTGHTINDGFDPFGSSYGGGDGHAGSGDGGSGGGSGGDGASSGGTGGGTNENGSSQIPRHGRGSVFGPRYDEEGD